MLLTAVIRLNYCGDVESFRFVISSNHASINMFQCPPAIKNYPLCGEIEIDVTYVILFSEIAFVISITVIAKIKEMPRSLFYVIPRYATMGYK